MSGYKLPSGHEFTTQQMMEGSALSLAKAMDEGASQETIDALLACYRHWKAQHEAEMDALDVWLAVRPHELT